jgi:hypothetical protein
MHLKEFLEYKTSCPLCLNDTIKTYFSAKSNMDCVINGSKFIIKQPIRNLQHRILYKIAHIFDLEGDSYCVEFYDDRDKLLNNVSCNKIKEFVRKNRYFDYFIYRKCYRCENYSYGSNLKFKLGEPSEKDFSVYYELFKISYPLLEGYMNFSITNYLLTNNSSVLYGKTEIANIGDHVLKGYLSLPLISFTDKEKVINKLQTLITFS